MFNISVLFMADLVLNRIFHHMIIPIDSYLLIRTAGAVRQKVKSREAPNTAVLSR